MDLCLTYSTKKRVVGSGWLVSASWSAERRGPGKCLLTTVSTIEPRAYAARQDEAVYHLRGIVSAIWA